MDPRQADHLPATPVAGGPEALVAELERERGALRIQAAAVAAQQAALTEQELNLQQQQQAFERQQEQLAAHLDVRRQRLLELQQRVQQARDELRSEQSAQRQEIREYRARWQQCQSELAEATIGMKAERQRLQDLRQRLKRRFHRHWAGERTRLEKQEKALATNQMALSRQAEELQRQQETLSEDHLRLNGERELNQRQLQDARRTLHQEQKTWKTQCALDRHQLDQAAANLGRLGADLVQARQALADRQQQAEQDCDRLAKEADGLELRVSNLRRKLFDQEQESRRLEEVLAEMRCRTSTASTPPTADIPASRTIVPVAAPVLEARGGEQSSALEAFAAKLADARSHILEHCLRLVRAWELWQQDHETVTAELDRAGQRLAGREADISEREHALEGIEAELRRRHDEMMHLQYQCESWQIRLRTGEAAWRAERETLLAGVRNREAQAERQTALLNELRERWAARRRHELDVLRAERARCQETMRRYAEVCDESLRRNQALEREARDLALRALSLEEYRLHFIATTDNAATTERRLVRLRQRWDKRFAAAERKLARDAATLTAAMKGLDEYMDEMQRLRDDLSIREEVLVRDLAAWEQERALAEIAHARMEAERESYRLHREVLERQLGEERTEIERVVYWLLLEGPAKMPAVMRAA